MRTLLTELEGIEQRYDVKVAVAWGEFESEMREDEATVDLRLRIQVPEANGTSSESFQQWRFELKDDDGWRVCDAHRTS